MTFWLSRGCGAVGDCNIIFRPQNPRLFNTGRNNIDKTKARGRHGGKQVKYSGQLDCCFTKLLRS